MTLLTFWRRLVQTARLSCGVPDYDVYVAHLRAHHPERQVPTYAEFFRDRQTARYKGTGGRCC
ncbi:YbdD/YjiX family protein [Dyella sp.]|uniref:YbdD/YjiX family protein n=1 Tax=Dyella sp. TaxID=1869338 RepID=UPI002D76E678|nr:YbdD/YjiX family protein [Dyella sp.]HET7330370.1 YbdD/YjiX family protein [Dyella sp.]